MNAPQLLYTLALTPHVEIVMARLPERIFPPQRDGSTLPRGGQLQFTEMQFP